MLRKRKTQSLVHHRREGKKLISAGLKKVYSEFLFILLTLYGLPRQQCMVNQSVNTHPHEFQQEAGEEAPCDV